jgi:acyl-CoA hydrolase
MDRPNVGNARHANPSGDIFGGWVLSQMDIAAGICAGQRAQGRVATVAIDAMKSTARSAWAMCMRVQ